MSKVKFIQWGTDTSPKLYFDRFKEDGTMADTFSGILSQYAGGIIFATYYKDNTKQDIVQEIWANGVQYSVGGGGGNVIYGTDMVDDTGKTYTWQIDKNTGDFAIDENGQCIPEYTNITGSEGSIYVYTGEKTQTAYYWKDNKWKPFNVDAENVWFTKGVQRTEPWGTAELPNARPEDECIGLNLKQLLEYYLVKETWPEADSDTLNTTTPSWSVEAPLALNLTMGGAALKTTELLYGSTITASCSYIPGLQLSTSSDFTTAADGTHSAAFTLGPGRITGLLNGYQFIDDGELSGELQKGEIAAGDQLNYKVVIDAAQTSGSAYPKLLVSYNMGGTGSAEIVNVTGTTHAAELSGSGTCSYYNNNNVKSVLGTRSITAKGTNSNTWYCHFYKGTVTSDGDIQYDYTATQDSKVTIPGFTVAIASNKYNVDTKQHTKTHDGYEVELVKSKSQQAPVVSKSVSIYLPIYEYKNGSTSELSARYKGSAVTVIDNKNLPLAMPDNCDNWWVEVPDCATLATFNVVTNKTNSMIGTNQITTINVANKSFNGREVPYKRIKFTSNAAYTTDAKITIKLS